MEQTVGRWTRSSILGTIVLTDPWTSRWIVRGEAPSQLPEYADPTRAKGTEVWSFI